MKSNFLSQCVISALSALLICGCSSAQSEPPAAYSRATDGQTNGQFQASAALIKPSWQQEILAAQQQHAHKAEVTVTAFVYKKLPDDTQGLPHERFLLRLINGSTVLVAHDTKLAPYVPLQAGDLVCLHGEYIWNEKGGVLHWTHHSPNGYHENGWIDYAGKRYQ